LPRTSPQTLPQTRPKPAISRTLVCRVLLDYVKLYRMTRATIISLDTVPDRLSVFVLHKCCPPSTSSPTAPPNMCRWRHVRHVYLACGHAFTLPEEHIVCEQRNCRFSPSHPPDCVLPKCRQTCWQYRQYPQQYSPNIHSACPTCQQSSIAPK